MQVRGSLVIASAALALAACSPRSGDRPRSPAANVSPADEATPAPDTPIVQDAMGSAPSDATFETEQPGTTPNVRIGPPIITGGLTPAIIGPSLRRAVAKISACYRAQRRTQSAPRGEVTLELEIASTGKVSRATARGVARELEDCIAASLEEMTFPTPTSGGTVKLTYPAPLRPVE